MFQPALMTALKPESVRMPPGVAMMIPTADKEVNGYANKVDNSFSHPGASRTGRVKSGEAAPAPTITATRKQGIQTIILPHNNNRKARQRCRAHTRHTTRGRYTSSEDQGATSPNNLAHHDTSTGVIDRDRVTSQSDMNVTPQRRGYMWSSLKRSCYVERKSGEGGAPSVVSPLALTYQFGRATSTPDGSRTSEITRRRPQSAVASNVSERDRMENSILDASSGDCRGVHSMKQDGADRTILEASATQSLGEVRGVNSRKKIETCPQWRKPWHFFSRQDEKVVKGVYPKKRYGADNSASETITPPRFEEVRGVYPKTRDGADNCISE